MTMKSFKCRLSQYYRKYKSIYDESIIYFITDKLSLQLEALLLLDGHKASFDNFSIRLKKNNAFKLHLKESLLISRDKPILNRNIYSFPLELFD